MLFIEWWFWDRLSIGLLMVAVATLSFWFVRKKGWRVRLPVQFLCALVALCRASGLLVGWLAMFVSHSYSVPVYSRVVPSGVTAHAKSCAELV